MKDTSVSITVPEDKNVKEVFNVCLWRIMLLSGVFIYGSYTVLVHLCEVDGKIPFSSASMVLVTEIMKILISISLFTAENWKTGLHLPTVWFCLPFAVPAILYCINNNIAVHMQLQMDPTTYQVLSNLKIASTALLYRLIIKRPISSVQWVSLGLLTVAGVFDSYGGFHAKGGKSAGEIHISLKGLLMILLYCFISGLSGVYTEYILKQHYQSSLHLQNMLLYSFGIILNLAMWIFQANQHTEDKDRFYLFKGYTVYTWIIIVTQAANGLIMSAVMKHASNITRLFIISCAMLVTTVLSVLIFQLQLNIYFGCAFISVIIALALYHT